MATRYWVGGSGDWNSLTTTNWSTTSGGGGGASAPTSADDVIFNSASSGASYVVTCSGILANVGNCKSITTTAPAVGTLTFNQVNIDAYFKVFDGNVNIHAACLFTGSGTITHAPATAGTYTVTFNSPGVNTQTVKYSFTQASASTTLNFCNSNTATFQQINTSVGGTFICTSAVLTNTTSSPSACTFGGGATSVTMTGTTLNMTGYLTNVLTIGGSTTSTWAISTLAVNMTDFLNPTGNILSIGRDSATQPTAMGAVLFTNCTGNAWFARASTLTLTGSTITLATALTTSGALTVGANSYIVNPSYTVSIGGTTTLVGTALFVSTSNTASTTFVGAVTATDYGGFTADTSPYSLNPGYALGSLTFSAGLTITPTGANNAILFANVIVADAITTTNTFVYAATSLTVNGGVGKAFSYTVNANANARGGTYAAYPFIAATSASITTPTTSFVGTNVRRVVYGFPRSTTKTANDTLTISGSTPTLTNVTFLGTSINAGATNYSGTRLGTDGLSNGFLPATGVQKFPVVPLSGTVAYDTAIWALTSNGAVSADNYPLPQDTVIFDSVSNNSTIIYVAAIHIGTVNMTANAGKLLYSGGVGTVYCYGDISLTGTAPVFCYDALQLTQSGNLNRSLTVIGTGPKILDVSSAALTLDTGNTTNLVLSGVVSQNFGVLYARSGTNEYLAGTAFGTSSAQVADIYFLGGTHTMRTTTFYASSFIISNGVVFPSSNYTVQSTPTGFASTYTNNAPTTALNGLVVLASSVSYTATITGTTATNPLKRLTLIRTGGSASTLSLSTESIYLEELTNGTNSGWNISGGGGVRGFVKTNGGTASIANVFITDVIASPLNTFFATGTSTLTGTTTGWTLGAAPASPPPGGFLFI